MMRQTMHGLGARRIDEGLQRELNAPAVPPGGWVEHDPVPVEVVHARISTSAVLPGALAVACIAHAAAVGVPCFGVTGRRGSGVCGDRVARRPSAVAS